MSARPTAETVCDRLPAGFAFSSPDPTPAEYVIMCAWTRRLKWNEQWVSVEDYLWERFRMRVSHGISDDAIQLMGDLTRAAR